MPGRLAIRFLGFAPGTHFFSSNERIAIAGVPLQTPDQGKATREEYLAYLRSVVQQFDLQVHTYEPVVAIGREGDEFVLTTRRGSGKRLCRSRRLILATGGTDRPRKLNIAGENLPHVSNYFQDPHTYFQKRLLIVGGKNSAVEAALRCHHVGAQVSLSYRQNELSATSIKYWLMPEMNELLRSGRIGGFFNTVPVEITPDGVTLRQAMSDADLRLQGKSRDIFAPFDFVLLLIGYEQDNALLRLAGVEISGTCGAAV